MIKSYLHEQLMRCMNLCRPMITLILIMFTGPTLASVININITVDLHESQIYDCGGGAHPIGTMCWTNNRHASTSTITPQTINLAEDTLVIRLDFADSRRIRWETDGISVPTYGDESVQVGAWGSGGGCCSSSIQPNILTFQGVRGDLTYNPLEWSFSSGGSGGIVSQSYWSGVTNLTDSFFEFDGIVSTIGPFTNSTDLPYTFDRVSIFFTSGNFSYVTDENLIANDVSAVGYSEDIIAWIPDIINPSLLPTVCNITSQASNGSALVESDCSSGSYQSVPGFIGIDSFIYTVTSGVDSSTATVTIANEIRPAPGNCINDYPLVIRNFTGSKGTITVDFIGNIISSSKKKIEICPATKLEYKVTSTNGDVQCKQKNSATATTGNLIVGDKLKCRDNVPTGSGSSNGHDKIKFKIKSGI